MKIAYKNAYHNFLESLRESGVCNMFQSPKYLEQVYGLSPEDAISVFCEYCEKKEEEARNGV